METVKRYFWNLLIAVDQLINAVFGGDPDETISSRVGKYQDVWVCRVVARILNLVDKNHCEKAIEEDEGGDAVLK